MPCRPPHHSQLPLHHLLQGAPDSDKPKRYKRRAGRRDAERAAKKQKKGHQAVASRQLADVSHVSGVGMGACVAQELIECRPAFNIAGEPHCIGMPSLLVNPSLQVEVESSMLEGTKIWFANTKGYK